MKRKQFVIDLTGIPLNATEINKVRTEIQRAIAYSLKTIPCAEGAIALQLEDPSPNDIAELFRRGGSVPFGSVTRYLQPEVLKISKR